MNREIVDRVKKRNPLVHNITNMVSATDCANITLLSGGSPIMASDPQEMEDIQTIASGLVINLGILNDRALEAMLTAGRTANRLSHPVIFDPVGAGASEYRTRAAERILSEIKITAVRCNRAELSALAGHIPNTGGVDSKIKEDTDTVLELARAFSEKTGAVIAVTGENDVIAGCGKYAVIEGGCPLLKKITASGCMLSSVCGVYVCANPENPFEAVKTAFEMYSECAGRAYSEGIGTASYKIRFFDEISLF